MSRLTEEQYSKMLSIASDYIDSGLQRKGQSYMNALFRIDVNLHNEISATNIDPFYDDSKLELFFNFLMNE